MKNLITVLVITLCIVNHSFDQETPLSPVNNTADSNFIENESSKMEWFILQDTLKIKIGEVHTDIQKRKEKTTVITTVNMEQTTSKWVDSTIVGTKNFEPIYHSSFNQQRDMVLNFGKEVTGYYLDKKTGTKTVVSEKTQKPYFDSNFYPQLIRWLPLNDGYSVTISIFDYNPTAKVGVITATIKNVITSSFNFNGKEKQVWKVETTDDISDNSATSTYYIDMETRKILKQDIDFKGRKMTMELME